MVDFLVRRDDPRAFRTDAGEPSRSDVADGAVQFEIECSGLTAKQPHLGRVRGQLAVLGLLLRAGGLRDVIAVARTGEASIAQIAATSRAVADRNNRAPS